MSKPRVLVVEDNELIRMLVVETLIDAGYDVEEAADADSAAKLIEADGYKLLVTDVQMPGRLDGVEFAELARDYDPAISVIVVTGRPDLLSDLRKTGVEATFLTKPFTLKDLVLVASCCVSPEPKGTMLRLRNYTSRRCKHVQSIIRKHSALVKPNFKRRAWRNGCRRPNNRRVIIPTECVGAR
jgi:CheY-like chemotaxis protein